MFNIIFTIAVIVILLLVWISILVLLKNSNTKNDDEFDRLIKEIREENKKKK